MSNPSSENESVEQKGQIETIERTVTVVPVPDVLRVDGGLVLGTEGLASAEGLKLARDGHTVLIPQPSNHPADCLNWSSTKKHLVLFTIAWGALCADFVGAISSAPIIYQAQEWHLSLDEVNRPTSIVVLILGLFGLVWVPMVSYWGRAPVLFWTEFFSFFFTLGTVLSPNYKIYFIMRCLSAAFLTAAQTISLAFLKDMFFFHERARKIGLWACLYICSPYMGPMMGNFVIGKTSKWQDIYWMCLGVLGLQLVFLVAFVDETWFNRTIPSDKQPERPDNFLGRMSRLVGIWQIQNHKGYFSTIMDTYRALAVVILQSHFALIAFSYFLLFCWIIGINITTSIIFATPISYGGYGYNNVQVGYLHFSVIVGIILAEIFGHWFNDFLARRYIHKHHGIFKPEARLWPIYIAVIFNVPGLVLVGQTIHHHLNVAGVVMGWGMFGFGIMLSSVAVTAYSLDSFPMAPAEVAAWLNLARTIGGFAVGFFQEPWGKKSGYDVSFGIQGLIAGLSIVPVVIVHFYGTRMRQKTSMTYSKDI